MRRFGGDRLAGAARAEVGYVLTKLVGHVGAEGRERGCDDVGVLETTDGADGHPRPDVIGSTEETIGEFQGG